MDLQITDDGDGFEVARTLQDAAQRGRLGLVGGSERVRLLGGTFDVRSRVGGPTTVSVTVPRWQPLAAGTSRACSSRTEQRGGRRRRSGDLLRGGDREAPQN